MRNHGTTQSYRWCSDGPDGTTCEQCREGSRRYQRVQRAKAQKRLAADPGIRSHGNASTYQHWGCRCDDCRKAASAERRKYAPYNGRPYVPRVYKRRAQPFGREWLTQ